MKKTMKAAVLAAAVFVFGAASALDVKAHTLKSGVEVEVAYPSLGHDVIDGRIRDWLEAILADSMRDMTSVVVSPDFENFTSEVQVGYQVVHASESAATVLFSTYTYPARAAHGMTRIDALNFDLRSGDMLSFDDCFEKPGKALEIMASQAKRLVNEGLIRDAADEAAGLADDDAAWFPDGFEPTRDNYAAFVLEPEGVRIIFQQYQVLPYVYGLPDALFTLEMLAPAGPRLEYWAGANAEDAAGNGTIPAEN